MIGKKQKADIIEKRRQDFPILKKLIYLDNSSTTQKPKIVLEAMNQYYTEYNANVHRGIYRISELATLAVENAREKIAKFVNAEPEEIIFTSGATESLNLLAHSLAKKIKAGDEIALTPMEHHSNLIPWQEIARERRAKIRYIPLTVDFRLDLKKAKWIINQKTRIVAITHMSNVLGSINPVTEIARLAQGVNALLILDAAQSVPHISVNVKSLGCDFMAFSGHKLCGPTGVGILYGKKHLLQLLDPVKYGGGMIKEVSFEKASWADIPAKFEAGTPNIAGIIGLGAAVEYLNSIGIDIIAEHEKKLTAYALQELRKIPGVKIYGPQENNDRGGVISFNIEGIHPHDIAEIADRYGIALRAGHHCAMPLHETLGVAGTARISFYFYNTAKDIDATVSALKKAKKIFRV